MDPIAGGADSYAPIFSGELRPALQIFYTLMAVALSAPLIVGLYSRRPTAARAIVAIVFSVGITAFTQSSPIGILSGFVILLLP